MGRGPGSCFKTVLTLKFEKPWFRPVRTHARSWGVELTPFRLLDMGEKWTALWDLPHNSSWGGLWDCPSTFFPISSSTLLRAWTYRQVTAFFLNSKFHSRPYKWLRYIAREQIHRTLHHEYGDGDSVGRRTLPWQYLGSFTGEMELGHVEAGEGKEEGEFLAEGPSHSKAWRLKLSDYMWEVWLSTRIWGVEE